MESKKILLADPSESVRKVIVNAFEDENFELLKADDFDSATELIASESPSLILAGISLPGRNGYALCEHVKSISPLTPVVMLVGTDETLDSEEALRVGANDYFIRPFKSQDLIEKISDLLAASARSKRDGAEEISAPVEPETTRPDTPDVEEPVMLEVNEPADYGDVPSQVKTIETPGLEDQEVDIVLEGLQPSDINESSEAFLAEMGIEDEEDEELDIAFGDNKAEEEPKPDGVDLGVEEEEDILEEFLSDIDDSEITEIETNEAATEEVEVQESRPNDVVADEISFNDDAVIEEPEVVGEVPGVAASVDEKGVAVEGIVEISKSKIEELIINNTKEDVKAIAYELVPGLAKDPISKVVPEAVKRASERLVGEIVKETTGQVAQEILEKIAAEIMTQKAAEHIARIANDAVMKAAEERIKEIANEAAEKAANEIISRLAEKTAVDVAERLIIGEIKSFKSKLSKEG